jgi:subtilisin family serine protease
MMRIVQMVLLVMWLAVFVPATAASAQVVGIDPLVPGRAMVRVNAGTIAGFLTVLNQDYPGLNAAVIDALPSRQMYLLQFNPPSPQVLDDLEDDLDETYVDAGQLVWGELLYEGQAPEGKTGSTWVDQIVGGNEFKSQYAATMLGLTQAQTQTTGAGVLVAVLDTGIDASHPILQGRIATGGYNFIANTNDTSDVGDGNDNDGDSAIDEMTGHGTYVAGLIALVAPQAQLLPVTVLNSDGVGDTWALLKGLYFAIDRGVEVINISLTTTYDSHALEYALLDAKTLGVAIAAAVGNFNRNTVPEYPGMTKREDGIFVVFGVASCDDQNVKSTFSNYSDVPHEHEVFITAPGATAFVSGSPDVSRAIISTLPGGEFGAWEGTSMSTPLVAGTLALIRAQHPEWPSNTQTWDVMRQRLTISAVNLYPMNPAYANPPQLGVGRLNTAAAVALGPPAPVIGDLNNDGVINSPDLIKVINDWSLVHTSADINNDGQVGIADLLLVIANWG